MPPVRLSDADLDAIEPVPHPSNTVIIAAMIAFIAIAPAPSPGRSREIAAKMSALLALRLYFSRRLELTLGRRREMLLRHPAVCLTLRAAHHHGCSGHRFEMISLIRSSRRSASAARASWVSCIISTVSSNSCMTRSMC